LNKSATNIPSERKIASIGPDDAMILPPDATPGRIKFSERTPLGLSHLIKKSHFVEAASVRALAAFFVATEETSGIR
jgi:hypothetical protein